MSQFQTNEHIWARELVRNDTLVEATYYANIGGLSNVAAATPQVRAGDTYLEADGGAARPWRVVHVRDGVQWYEELAYLPYAFGDRTRYTSPLLGAQCLQSDLTDVRCSPYYTTGNMTRRSVHSGAGRLLREDEWRYRVEDAAPDSYLDRNLLGLVTWSEVRDGDGSVVARSEWTFDEDPEDALIASGMSASRRIAVGSARGNPTTTRAFIDDATAVVTRAEFYDAGVAHRVAAPRGRGDLDGGYTTTTEPDFRECGDSHTVRQTTVRRPRPGSGSSAIHEIVQSTDCFTELVLRIEAVDDAVTCHRYDAHERLVESALPGDTLSAATGIVDPSCAPPETGATGPTTTVRYELAAAGGHSDPLAQRVITTAKNGDAGMQSIVFIDGLGRPTAECGEVDPAEAENNRFACTRTSYDALDRTTESSVAFWVMEAPSHVPTRPADTRYVARRYDAVGRAVWTELAGSQLGAIVTSYGGDGIDFVTTETDRNGYDSVTHTDLLGRVLRREREWQDADDGLSTACTGNACTTTMGHDALGRLLTVAQDDGRIITTHRYDWLGRRVSTTDADMGGFSGGSWMYAYDEHGNQLQSTDPGGNTIRFAYDALDRVTEKRLPEAIVGDEAERVVSFHYDGSGPPPPN